MSELTFRAALLSRVEVLSYITSTLANYHNTSGDFLFCLSCCISSGPGIY